MFFKVSVILNSGEELFNSGTVAEHVAAQIQEAATKGGRITLQITEHTVVIVPTASINYIKVTKVFK